MSRRLRPSQRAIANMPRSSLDEARSVLLVEVHEHFGVALGGEPVAASLELGPKLAVVVDLAVLDDPDRLVLVADRLIAAREIDDGQASRSEADVAVDVRATAVGAAVNEGLVHRSQDLGIDPFAVEPRDSADSTHATSVVRRGSKLRSDRPA